MAIIQLKFNDGSEKTVENAEVNETCRAVKVEVSKEEGYEYDYYPFESLKEIIHIRGLVLKEDMDED